MNQRKEVPGSRVVSRNLPFGLAERVEGNALHLSDGRSINLAEVFGQPEFCEMNYRGFTFVRELVEEVFVLRKMLLEQVRREGVRLSDSNEFYRGLASFAGKIGEHPDTVRAIVEPMVRMVFEDMLRPRDPRPSNRQRQHGRHGGGHG